jgi:hypothetical protein
MRAATPANATRRGMKNTNTTQTHAFHATPRHARHAAVAHYAFKRREFKSPFPAPTIVSRIACVRAHPRPRSRVTRGAARRTRIYAPAGFFFAAGFFAAGFFFVAVVFFTAGFFAAGFFAAGFFAAGFFAAGFFAGALATMLHECVGGFGCGERA